jgi:hypothetical protein
VTTIFKTKLKLHSSRDLEQQEGGIGKTKNHGDDYRKIKPKHLKEQLMMNYLIGLKHKYNLTAVEFRNLISRVALAFQFKSLTADSVVCSNGKIKTITGLKFNAKRRIFAIPEPSGAGTRSEPRPLPNRFYATLDKYLKEHKARVAKFVQ